jgi:hypothetical protein
MRHLWLGGACLAIALAACSPDPDAVGRPMTATGLTGAYLPPVDPCGAGRLRGLVGQNAAALNSAALPAEYRIVYPWNEGGGAFRAERLTVTVDASTTITRITCG